MLSSKQIQSIKEATRRFNVWCGAVRSGKTFASNLKLIDLLKSGPKGDVMIVGVNRESIQRNVLNLLFNLLGGAPPSSKTNSTKIYGRNVYFVGAHDESAVRAIQGSTLALAYVDEITCIPAPFWKMLCSRLSIPGAKLIGTTNPEGPSHWFKREFLDRPDLDLISWNFTLDDNPSLDENYKANLKKEYTGMWYKRYILGEWAVAHGLIYDSFDELNLYEDPQNEPNYYIVGIDYGTSNATAAVLCAINPTKWPQIRIVDEYYYDSVVKGRSKTDAELSDDIYRFVEYKNVRAVYVDPSAASLKLELRNRNLPVLDANNDVLEGIKITSKFIAGKNLVVHKSCRTLIDVIQSYSWCPKSADRGIDKPLKEREHICVSGNTLVLTDKGYFKIKDLFEGNLINYKNGCLETDSYKNVCMTKRNAEVMEIELEDGKKLIATPDHKLMTIKGMKMLQDLTLCDVIITCKEDFALKAVRVKSIGMAKNEDVYCLSSGKNGNFIANGIVVSNCDALRYATYSNFPRGQFSTYGENMTIDQIRREVYGEEPLIMNPGVGGYY